MNETSHPDDGLPAAHSAVAANAATHGDGGHGDGGHGQAEHADGGHGGHAGGTPLGPIDWAAWGAGLLGIAAGLAVAVCLYLATAA